MSNLQNSIKNLYGSEMSEEDAAFAESNLLAFFKTLEKIDTRISIKNKSNDLNQKSNELKNEHIRSAN